jgi:hypothetical protein
MNFSSSKQLIRSINSAISAGNVSWLESTLRECKQTSISERALREAEPLCLHAVFDWLTFHRHRDPRDYSDKIFDYSEPDGMTGCYGAHEPVCAGIAVQMMQLLLQYLPVDKWFIDFPDERGTTALMAAASTGNAAMVELFLADIRVDKASLDHADINDYTALMHAAAGGQ